jgi:hypothetical protein
MWFRGALAFGLDRMGLQRNATLPSLDLAYQSDRVAQAAAVCPCDEMICEVAPQRRLDKKTLCGTK